MTGIYFDLEHLHRLFCSNRVELALDYVSFLEKEVSDPAVLTLYKELIFTALQQYETEWLLT